MPGAHHQPGSVRIPGRMSRSQNALQLNDHRVAGQLARCHEVTMRLSRSHAAFTAWLGHSASADQSQQLARSTAKTCSRPHLQAPSAGLPLPLSPPGGSVGGPAGFAAARASLAVVRPRGRLRRLGGFGGCPPDAVLRAAGEGGRRPPNLERLWVLKHCEPPAKEPVRALSIERRRVATGANHPASHSSALRRGPGTPAVGAPAGDQSTGKNVTPNMPLVRQDPTSR
jgi:hypothetical protein